MRHFVLYFHFEDRALEHVLPAADNRKYQVDLGVLPGLAGCAVKMEVWDGAWHMLADKGVSLSINGEPVSDHILADGDVLNGLLLNRSLAFTVMVLALDSHASSYLKFDLRGIGQVQVGNRQGADLRIDDPFVSQEHCVLRRKGEGFTVLDHSRNGTYLNGARIQGEVPLKPLDTLYLAGVKLVLLGDLLLINHAELIESRLPAADLASGGFYCPEKPEGYGGLARRAPRVTEPMDAEPVELEVPPPPQKQRRQPLIFTIGPSLTMPLPILMSVLINLGLNSNRGGMGMYIGTIVSVALSALVGAGWAVAHRIYDKRVNARDELDRREGYLDYIEKNRALLEQKQRYNSGVLSGQYLSTAEFLSLIRQNRSILWNRNIHHADFMTVRIGKGEVPLPAPIRIPKERFSLCRDPLVQEPYKLYEQFRTMKDAVVLLPLADFKQVGVIGERERVLQIGQNLLLQAAALHCYTDLRIAFLCTPGEWKQFEWARFLPHTFTDDRRLRMVACEPLGYQSVLFYLAGVFREREEGREEREKKETRYLPHYLVFCTDMEILRNGVLSSYLTNDKGYGATFVLLAGQLDHLPNECVAVLEASERFTGFYRLDESRDETSQVAFDGCAPEQAEELARLLGSFYVPQAAGGEIPASIEFLEMYGLTRVEQWALLKHWKENRTYENMRALIGVKNGGQPMYLDIHEKQHGPHGLVAGTTGSGKSETVQTYILSLAMNYHPDELAFILIDYKGGGMAHAFENLPHLAGTITNLDGSQTRRALVSIKSEIKRRQAVFNRYKVNHIDLYARLYRAGTADEPIPHLIIISDEFAELKKEQPEFIKELVSTARVGRSLGIHLILATQKPSGVVDDEIWSNSRFKLCLRVQDKQDSNEMLKKPDAAYLTHTGRAYLQIGQDELFELFQSGYSGAAYEPKDQPLPGAGGTVEMIGLDGGALVLRAKAKEQGPKLTTQLDACVRYICAVAGENHIRPTRPLWLPELPKSLSLSDLPAPSAGAKDPGALWCVYGLADNPEAQTQAPATLNLGACGNLLIAGNAGCGKSTLLQTLLYSLAAGYTPGQVQFYCLDFSSHILRPFAAFPHCGGVVFQDDAERVERLFTLLEQMIETRKRAFDRESTGSFAEYCLLENVPPLPAVLLVIDNYFVFGELYADLEEALLRLTRDGMKYGIHVVASVIHAGDMKYKMRQNFSVTIPLSLTERGDYMDVLGVMPDFLPTPAKGRGLVCDGGAVLEFQCALPTAGATERDRSLQIEARAKQAGSSWRGARAPAIPCIPREEPYAAFLERVKARELWREKRLLPIGYDLDDLSLYCINLRQVYCYAISDASGKGGPLLLKNLLCAAERLGATAYLLNLRAAWSEQLSGLPNDGLYQDEAGLVQLLLLLKGEFTARSNARKDYVREHGNKGAEDWLEERFPQIFVLIDSMDEFCELVYNTSGENKSNLVETFFKQGAGLGVHFFAGFDPAVYGANFYKQAVRCFIAEKAGLHLGGRMDQQKLFDFSLPVSVQMKPAAPNHACIAQDTGTREVFVPLDS